jgi:hypothetical protein
MMMILGVLDKMNQSIVHQEMEGNTIKIKKGESELKEVVMELER